MFWFLITCLYSLWHEVEHSFASVPACLNLGTCLRCRRLVRKVPPPIWQRGHVATSPSMRRSASRLSKASSFPVLLNTPVVVPFSRGVHLVLCPIICVASSRFSFTLFATLTNSVCGSGFASWSRACIAIFVTITRARWCCVPSCTLGAIRVPCTVRSHVLSLSVTSLADLLTAGPTLLHGRFASGALFHPGNHCASSTCALHPWGCC